MKIRKVLIHTILSPNQLYKKIRKHFKNTFLFQIGANISQPPTYTIIGFDPQKLIILNNEDSTETIFRRLRKELEPYILSNTKEIFVGGLFGVVAYDSIRSYESLPNLNKSDKCFPDALFGLFLDGIIYEHSNNVVYYFFHSKIISRNKVIKKILALSEDQEISFSSDILEYQISKKDFLDQVIKLKEFISNGEVYQTVLSQRIAVQFSGDPFVLYEQLCKINPSPYLFFIEFAGFHVFGTSPETLVTIENGLVKTFPIAGSRPRGVTKKQKLRFRKDLLDDPKENSEHNMLVDLARNDLGKVCRFGTIHITKYRQIEEFSHIIHLVSIVQGQLQEGKDACDVLEAVFPAGTVTGAPKVRSMEIIEEFEKMRRGPYAGAVGYISCNFNTDTAIAIRTFYTSNGKIYLQAGAGIVIDSDPEKEYSETLNKLQALLSALNISEKTTLSKETIPVNNIVPNIISVK